ncbi:Coatomer subunit beta'-2 [Vitis vinifera]|uniref:Coatomer subunit beta'-2 n=1 Tax=Vitis vinifera TaxID=29760 RepID=A0A438DF42_VITVI|nr:Coatomer subunit beta'-2 [Vitis vinifera]
MRSSLLLFQTMAKSFEVTELPVRSAKFIARKQWVVAGADDMFIRVYNYNTMDKVKVFEAHTDYIRCVAVHPTLPYVLSSSDDMLIKLWDWEKGWVCTQIFDGHSHYVMQVTFNPKDTNTFASASLDRTIKIWNLGSPDPNFTLDAHQKGVNCVDYFTGGDKPYLITGSDDHTAKVWDYQTKSCVQTLEGHTHNVSAVCFHPELPIIITGSEDGTVRIWHATTYRLENTLNYGLERVWAVGYMKGSRRVVIGYDEGSIMVKLGREVPVASMDNSGKIIWAKHNEIQTVNIKSVGADFEVTDGERLPLAVKELGTCDLYPQSLKHNPNGRFVVVCGDGEYIIYTALAWRNRSFGSALEFVWSSDGEYAVRESTSKVKIFSKNFQEKRSVRPTFSAEHIFGGTLLAMCSNDFICFYDWAECRLIRRIDVNVKNLYWADSGDLVAIASDTSFYILKYNRDVVTSYLDSGRPVDEQGVEDAFELLHETNERVRTGIWVGDCFIYNNSSWRLNYCVGGEVTTMFHLDRPMYLLGYLANQSRVYLIDKEFNVMGYTLLLSLIEYKTLVMRGDLERANELLPSIPKEHHNSVARFLESRGMIEDALEVATDPDYRFELAMQLGRLEVAKDIATEVQSESKWKQLGELAMSTGKLEMAEECLKHAMDLSGLLLLYSSLGDADGISKLASLAKEQGKNNVAFLCLFMLGKLEECLQLLVDSNRIPEAALMARSYLPSKVSEIVALWRKDLNKVNPKAAESLADPEEYPNLFEDWQVGLAIESKVAETRSIYPPAEEYLNCADRSHINLVEAFRNLQMEEEEPLENGDASHEVQNGEESQEEHNGEEAVVVDADSTDGAVLVNGNEAEEEWGASSLLSIVMQYLLRTICRAYSLRSLKSLINMLQCLHHVTRSHQDSRSQLYSFPTQEGGGIKRQFSFKRFLQFYSLASKLEELKAKLKVWNKEVSGNIVVRKEMTFNQLGFWDSEERGVEDLTSMACLSKFWIGKRQGLELPLSEEEIFSAWSDLNGGKAPGRIFGAFLVSSFALETAIRFCLTNCQQSGFHPFMKGNFLLKFYIPAMPSQDFVKEMKMNSFSAHCNPHFLGCEDLKFTGIIMVTFLFP